MVRLSGDPVTLFMPMDIQAKDVNEFRERLGFNDPLGVQYARFIGGAVRGDFGESLRYQRDALGLVLERLPATLLLAGTALVLTFVVAVPLGVVSAVLSSPGMPVSEPGASVSPDGDRTPLVATSRAPDGGLTLPAASDWIAVRVWTPAASLLAKTPQLPSLPTGELPIGIAPSYKVTPSPGTPVPRMIGRVRVVTLSPGTPLSVSGDSTRPDGDGTRIRMGNAADLALTLPTLSDSIAVKLWRPGASRLGKTPQLPSWPTGELPITVAPSRSVTPSPGAPVPVTIGLVAVVMLSP